MLELINQVRKYFSAFLEVMLFIPAELQIRHWYEAVVLLFILVVALGVIFLCARWMNKYKLGFPASILLAFLILSLTLGLAGILLSIPRPSLSALETFGIVFTGSAAFNLVLGAAASLGNRLRNNYPLAGTLLLCGVGFLFAYILFTSVTLFALQLFIT